MTNESGGAATGEAASGQDLAGLGERFTALFIDWVLCLVVTYTLQWFGLLELELAGVNLATPAVFAVYYALTLAVATQSVGMSIMRIACVSATTGAAIGFGRSIVRAVLLSLVLPALTALADPYHRGLHDKAASSVMLKASRAAGA